jgi:hypothetical protein
MDSMMVGEPEWKYWITPWGNPASVKAPATCSTTVGVCGDGLRMTELPDRSAGIRALTRIRYGY